MRKERLLSEKLLLAKLLKNREARAKYLGAIKPSDFLSKNNGNLLVLLCKLGKSPTRRMLLREIKKSTRSNKARMALSNTLRKMVSVDVSELSIDYIYEDFRKNIITDERIDMMLRYVKLVESNKLPDAEKLFKDHYYRSDLSINDFLVDEGEIADDLKDRIKMVKLRKKYPERYRGVKTGIKELDRRMDGLCKGEFGLLFGLVSIGKSTVILNFVHHARMTGHNVMVICNEMPKLQVEYRYDSLFTGMEYSKFKKGRINYTEIEKWKRYYKEEDPHVGKLFIISVGANCTTDFIDRKLGEYKARKIDIGMLVIDSISYVESSKRSWSEQHGIGLVAKDMKDMALKRDIPVWCLAQATVESEDEERYTAKNIGYSRRQIHIADVAIAVLMREADREEDTLTLQIVKNREEKKDIFIRVKPLWGTKKIKELR